MKMENWRKDGFDMFTKLIRALVKWQRSCGSHCGDGPTGHCS